VVGVFSAIVYLANALGRLWGFIGDLLLILFFAWLVGSVLIHVVNSLMRIPHMNRPLAIVLVYIGLITLIADFALIVIPSTIDQASQLSEQIPALVQGIRDGISRTDEILAGLGIEANLSERIQIQSMNDVGQQVQRWLTQPENFSRSCPTSSTPSSP
jgi:predicted PurR-regulated permease PerM